MEEAELLKKMERYLEGKMDSGELTSFEKEMRQNPLLKEQVDQLLRTKAAVFSYGRSQEKASLLQEWDNWEAQQSANRRPFFRSLGIAAAIALLIGFALYVFLPSPTPSAEQLFAAHYERPEGISIRNPDSTNILLAKAHSHFNQGELEEAIALYTPLSAMAEYNNRRDEISFFLGISYLETGQTTAAIDQLRLITNGSYLPATQWYQILALIQLDELEDAKTSVEHFLQAADPYYKSKAEDLLKDL